MPGKVSITLKNVEVTRKEDKFKSMSPWAVVMFDGQKKTTNPLENGNLQPQYNETWNFQRNSAVKITVSLYKKEYTYDALKNEKENDLLIGKGTLNILSTLKRAKKQPVDIVIDLVHDYDNKPAGQAFLTIQFTPGTNIEEYRNSEQMKQLRNKYESCLSVSNIVLNVDSFKPDASYYIKVRNPNCSSNTPLLTGGKSLSYQGSYDVYFRGQKIVYFDVQEVFRDDQLDIMIGDDLVGIGILDFEKNDINEVKQTVTVKQRGKQVGTIICQVKYEVWKSEEIPEEASLVRQSNDELKEQIKNLEKKDKFWLSPERFQLDQMLKKKSILDRRSMLMKHRSTGQLVLGNESQMFMKPDEKNLIVKPDIVISTTTVKLPKLKTNNHVEVPTQYSKQYFRDVHGVGFSTVESSSSLQKSVPKFSIPEQKRFLGPKDNFPGPGRYGTSGVANDIHLPKKFQKITAISEVRTTKLDRKPRQQIDTGLKKDKDKSPLQAQAPK